MQLPFFEKVDYERCLPWILPLRKYADRVKLIFHVMPEDDSLPFFDYLATNEFLKAVKVSSCFRGDFALSSQVTKEIYWKCPYARQVSYFLRVFHMLRPPRIFLKMDDSRKLLNSKLNRQRVPLEYRQRPSSHVSTTTHPVCFRWTKYGSILRMLICTSKLLATGLAAMKILTRTP